MIEIELKLSTWGVDHTPNVRVKNTTRFHKPN